MGKNSLVRVAERIQDALEVAAVFLLLLGYTDDVVYAAGGNPYGTSWPAGYPSTMPDETVLECARYQGRRLTRFTETLAAARAEPAASV